MVTYDKRHPLIMPHNSLTTWSRKVMTNLKQNISSSTEPMVTKPGRVVAYEEGISLMISQDPLTMESREVT